MNKLLKVIIIGIILYALYLLFGNFIMSQFSQITLPILKNNLLNF